MLWLTPDISNKQKNKSFKEAVEATPNLRDSWRAGLGALRAEDKLHVKIEEPGTVYLRGSTDVDNALKRIQPNANRWDFAIGYRHSNVDHEMIYWVEFHTGSDGQIKKVLAKLEWLKNWLHEDGKELAKFPRYFIWAPSGATHFTQGSPQVRSLALKGLKYTGSNFSIPKAHPPKWA
jgi:hypothetical protein